MYTLVTFWQRLGNTEHEVGCAYFHNGRQYTGEVSDMFYTGKTRSVR